MNHDPDDPGYARGPGDALDPDYLRQRVNEAPSDWRRWFQLGVRLLNICEEDAARDALREGVRLNPENGLAHRLLAQAMVRTSRPASEVLEVATRAVQLRPADHRAWSTVASAAGAERKLALALEAWEQVARLAPDAETYWRIGTCLHLLARDREAIVALEEVVRLKPNHLPALRLLYLLGRAVGEDDTARANIDALFRCNPVRARELMEGYVDRPWSL